MDFDKASDSDDVTTATTMTLALNVGVWLILPSIYHLTVQQPQYSSATGSVPELILFTVSNLLAPSLAVLLGLKLIWVVLQTEFYTTTDGSDLPLGAKLFIASTQVFAGTTVLISGIPFVWMGLFPDWISIVAILIGCAIGGMLAEEAVKLWE